MEYFGTMNSQSDTRVSEMKEKLSEYEIYIAKLQKALKDIVAEEKTVAKVVSGPEVFEKTTYFRVVTGGGEKLVGYNGNLLFNDEIPKEGQEVVLIKEAIVAVVPETLKLKTTDVSTIKLVEWEEIGGMKSQIDNIRKTIEAPLKHAEAAKEMGLEPVKGLLLYGPPGCGKTLVAKAIAATILKGTEAKKDSFVYIKGPELLSKFIGESERVVRLVFQQCRDYANKYGQRAVIFIDEAESLLPVRGSKRSSDVESTIVPQFLSEMDGFEDNSPFVILASNLPESIDEAVLREGRIDLKIKVDRPTVEDMREIFMIHLARVKCEDQTQELSKKGTQLLLASPVSESISGAMIKTMVNLAAQSALYRRIEANGEGHKVGLKVIDLETARKQIVGD